MPSGKDDPGESRMGEISMSGSTREREAPVIGLRAFHSVAFLSTLLVTSSLPNSSKIQNVAAVASLNNPPSNQKPMSKTSVPARHVERKLGRSEFRDRRSDRTHCASDF